MVQFFNVWLKESQKRAKTGIGLEARQGFRGTTVVKPPK
jgi:hypothetical protein